MPRRLEGTPPESHFDGASAEAPNGETVTPEQVAGVYWRITGSMLSQVCFRPRVSAGAVADPSAAVVVGRQRSSQAWDAFDTELQASLAAAAVGEEEALVGSERAPV